jgi:signal transduction histidine kinase
VDVARIEAGRLTIERSPVDLCEIAREVAALYAPTSDRHELVLRLPSQPLCISCDATRVRQVLGNLVLNAIRYSPSGGLVEVALEAEHGEVTLSVSDEGIGIPAEMIEKAFRPFWLAPAEQPGPRGAGLGLAICRGIVEAHGGHVDIESEQGIGTTVRVVLPASDRGVAALGSTPARPGQSP